MTIVAILKETTHNVLAQCRKSSKTNNVISCIKSRLYGRSYQYHAWLLLLKESEKKTEKKQLNLQYLQRKKRGFYKQTRTHTCIQSTHIITQQSPSVTHSRFSSVTQSVPLHSSCLQSHMMLDTHPESILV